MVHDKRERCQEGTVLGGGSRWCMTKERKTSRRHSAWWRILSGGSRWCMTIERDVKEAQCLVEEAGGA